MIHEGLYHTFAGDDFEKFRFITQLFWFLSVLTFILLAPIVFLIFEHLFLLIRRAGENATKILMFGSIAFVFIFAIIFLALNFGISYIYFGWMLMGAYFALIMLKTDIVELKPPENKLDNVMHNLMPGALLGAVVPFVISILLSLLVILPSAYSLMVGNYGAPIYNIEIKVVAITVMLILFDAYYISSGVLGAIFATLINSILKKKKRPSKKRINKRRGKKR